MLNRLEINAKDMEETNEFKVIGGRLSQMQENLRQADDRLKWQNNMFRKAYLDQEWKEVYEKKLD